MIFQFYKIITLFSLLFLTVISCKQTQIASTNNTINKQKKEPQISFFYFNATKQLDSTIQIQLTKQNTVDGKLKGFFYKTIPIENLDYNKWLVSFTDIANNNINQLQILNPLVEHIEFVNHDGNFERKTIYHNTKVFVVRLPYTISIKNIKFEKITAKRNGINKNIIAQIPIK